MQLLRVKNIESQVYLAENINNKQKVVIKVLSNTLDDNLFKRFRQEYLILKELNHPHIVKIIDHVYNEEIKAIVMEYIEGKYLQTYVEEKGKLSEQEIINLTLQILDALQYTHEKGIIHRDIKPSNIIITQKGSVKIIDFGIAKAIKDKLISTKSFSFLGTPLYMSPEQINNPKNVDHRTDIYSVGLLIYFMATGKAPFKGKEDTFFTVMEKILKQPVPKIGIEKLDKIIQRATVKNPEDRFFNIQEFKNYIEIYLYFSPIATAKKEDLLATSFKEADCSDKVNELSTTLKDLKQEIAHLKKIANKLDISKQDKIDRQLAKNNWVIWVYLGIFYFLMVVSYIRIFKYFITPYNQVINLTLNLLSSVLFFLILIKIFFINKNKFRDFSILVDFIFFTLNLLAFYDTFRYNAVLPYISYIILHNIWILLILYIPISIYFTYKALNTKN